MKLCSYLRVSTVGQAEEDRFGIPRQRHDVERFLERANGAHELVAEFVEVASGTHGVADREAFPDMLARLRDGDFDGVVLGDLTRLSRLLTTQEALLAVLWSSGARVFTANGAEVHQDDPDDPMRTAMRQMAGVFSQLERSMISKRLRDGRKAKARVSQHYAWTFAPWGYMKEGSELHVDSSSAAWDSVSLATSLRDEGHSLRRIARALEAARLVPPRGSSEQWSASQVARVLRLGSTPTA